MESCQWQGCCNRVPASPDLDGKNPGFQQPHFVCGTLRDSGEVGRAAEAEVACGRVRLVALTGGHAITPAVGRVTQM